MSLNKFTDVQKGIDLKLDIGADEIKCNTFNTTTFTADAVEADTIEAKVSLIAGDLTYPTSETPAIEFQYPTSQGDGTLQMLPSLPWLSYGFIRSNSAGAPTAISNFGAFTLPNTPENLSSLPAQFYSSSTPYGPRIEKPGLYRVFGTVRCIRSVADPSTYCAFLVNGSDIQQTYQTVASTGVNQDMGFSISDYIQLNEDDVVQLGIAGTTGGNVTFEYWKIALEFIK